MTNNYFTLYMYMSGFHTEGGGNPTPTQSFPPRHYSTDRGLNLNSIIIIIMQIINACFSHLRIETHLVVAMYMYMYTPKEKIMYMYETHVYLDSLFR